MSGIAVRVHLYASHRRRPRHENAFIRLADERWAHFLRYLPRRVFEHVTAARRARNEGVLLSFPARTRNDHRNHEGE
jgi:hypothetical protein